MTEREFVSYVKDQNPNGRGRPYSISRLVTTLGIRPRPPRRITIDMRLELSDLLDSHGLAYDKILDEKSRNSRVYYRSSQSSTG
jgi:hypothetical protein